MIGITTSADGSTIAYELTGDGPGLVLVGGALSDRHGAADLARALSSSFSVIVFDRRGRGLSGDTPPYDPAREIEDLAALVDVLGGSARVYGHSSGGVLALRAAVAGVSIDRLAVYEPPFVVDDSREPVAVDLLDRVQGAVDQGRPGDAVELFMTEAVGVPAPVVAGMKASPAWPTLESLGHTIPYDLRLVGDQGAPLADLAGLSMPVLIGEGAKSPRWVQATTEAIAATVPGARHERFDDQDHGIRVDVIAPVLVDFFG